MSKKVDNLIVVENDFATCKNYIVDLLSKIVSKIKNKESLKAIEKFFILLVVCRSQFSKYQSRYEAVDYANSVVINDLQAYSKSYDKDDQRINFADHLHKAFQTCSYRAQSKKADASKLKAFAEIQSTYTLHNSLNIIDSVCKISKANKKILQQFRVCKHFIQLCDTFDDIKIIESYALKK